MGGKSSGSLDINRALVELLLRRDSVVQISPVADWEELGRFLGLIDGARHDAHDAWLVMLALKERTHIVTSNHWISHGSESHGTASH
ncbi:hypothetical protein F4553_001416 [Allocatelliglobosispora scoriae]|uniref:Uncharacterized protein n=1 Tax=Allocatelliglobosispora scoriae TaxID=643052 RepID=A0A841BG23_9ACTN|nr:hypothetical protein [Allocatelliglobosispora scoriae]MBB5868037.1 hypothetical protein [Allocatelliglobosispora scoriae]